MMRTALTSSVPAAFDQKAVSESLLTIATRIGLVATPVLLIVVITAAAANLVQAGFLWVPNAIIPQLGRLDPSRNLSRWWSLSAWAGQLSSIIKLIVLVSVLMMYVRLRLSSAGPLVNGSVSVIYTLSTRLIGELAVVLSLSLVVLALVDYGYQFWQTERRLMMTVEEVRREQREDEGNSALKRRQREVAQTSRSVDASRPV
jgi:type III secretion protein U